MSTQAFPVIPSASTGGGGSSGVQWIEIEDLGTGYTHTDPDSRVTSYAYNSGTKEHTFELAVLPFNASGYPNYSVSTSAGVIAEPRWVTPLVDENGVALTSDDEFSMLIKMDGFAPGTMQNWCAMLGFSRDGTTTTKGVAAYTGAGIGYASSGTPTGMCLYAGSNVNTLATANGDAVIGHTQVAGAGRGRICGTLLTMFSSTTAVQTSRTGTLFTAAATPLWLEIRTPTISGAAFTGGTTWTVKMRYAIVRT